MLSLAADLGLGVLHLYRRNLLARVVSESIATASGIYHSDQNQEVGKIRLNPDRLIGQLRNERQKLVKMRNLIGKIPCVELAYEDAFHDGVIADSAAGALSEWLGVEPSFPPPALKKITRGRSLSELISNSDDVWRALQNTQFSEQVSGPQWSRTDYE